MALASVILGASPSPGTPSSPHKECLYAINAPRPSDPAIKGQIGTNVAGEPIVADENGVRSRVTEQGRVTESVEIRPSRDGGYVPVTPDEESRSDDFLTTEEIDTRQAAIDAEANRDPIEVIRDDIKEIKEAINATQQADQAETDGVGQGRREPLEGVQADDGGRDGGRTGGVRSEGSGTGVGGVRTDGSEGDQTGRGEGDSVEPIHTDPSGGADTAPGGDTGGGVARSSTHNHILTEQGDIGAGGPKTRFRKNITAIQTLKAIETEGRPATLDEKEALVQYVGWGGIPQAFDYSEIDPNAQLNEAWEAERAELRELLTPQEYESARASTTNAHYTSIPVIQGMYHGLGVLGVSGGGLKILEPSVGTGNFFGALPETLRGTKLFGVELDDVTARIAQNLVIAVITGCFFAVSWRNVIFCPGSGRSAALFCCRHSQWQPAHHRRRTR